MLNSQEEIFVELDLILDQLLHNANVIKKCEQTCSIEMALLNQTQKSLMARFVHTQEYVENRHALTSKKRKRQEDLDKKLQTLQSLDPILWDSFSNKLRESPSLGSRPRVGRNRKKLKTSQLSYCQF